ncbi:MAG: PilZ domain-containing protein [Chloroflexota bacterium]|nr:PilZ domain-containing protein [Chloroflexota bacterium]
MVVEQRSASVTSLASSDQRAALVRARWQDPASGRELSAETALQDIVHEGLILVRQWGAHLPDPCHVVRLIFPTDQGPFVVHAKVVRLIGPHAALVRPMTDARLHERRRWPRVTLPPVQLRIYRQDGAAGAGRVLDLSVRGIRFETELALVSGDRCRLELTWEDRRIPAAAVVIAAVDAGTAAAIYRCRFEEISPEAEDELALLVNELLPSRPQRVARLHLNQIPATASILLLGEWVEGEPFEIRLLELGVSMVRFTSGRRLPPGTLLRIDLVVDGAPPFVVDAEVNAAEEASPEWHYEAKLRTLSDVARRAILANVVRSLLTKRSRELCADAALRSADGSLAAG